MNNKTVAIFGVFDGVHEGHRQFISSAKMEGDKLVAIVARDSVVEKLKGKVPHNTEVDRIKALLEVPEIDQVLLGDIDEGTYNVLKEIKPDLIYLGYDQNALYENLINAIDRNIIPNIPILKGEPHKPDIFKSSIIRATL